MALRGLTIGQRTLTLLYFQCYFFNPKIISQSRTTLPGVTLPQKEKQKNNPEFREDTRAGVSSWQNASVRPILQPPNYLKISTTHQ